MRSREERKAPELSSRCTGIKGFVVAPQSLSRFLAQRFGCFDRVTDSFLVQCTTPASFPSQYRQPRTFVPLFGFAQALWRGFPPFGQRLRTILQEP